MIEERLKSLPLILERMNVLYLRAIELLDRERRSLILFEYEELFTLFREKDEILSAVRALDKDRLKQQDLFALLTKQASASVTLQSMGDRLISLGAKDEVFGRRLLALRQSLSQTIENLRQKIVFNQEFVDKSIQNLQSIAEHVTSSLTGRHPDAKKSTVYTGKGKFNQPAPTAGGLLEKRL